MTNIIPINPADDDDGYGVGYSVMRDIRKMLEKETIPHGGVVLIGVIDGDCDHTKMNFLIDDGDVWRVSVDLVGCALGMAEDVPVS